MNDQKALGAFIENVYANRKERTHKCCRSTAIVCYFIFLSPFGEKHVPSFEQK